MKTEEQLRLENRETPAGRLLWRMGMDYWDTESCARRVAEHAAGEIDELLDVLKSLLRDAVPVAVEIEQGENTVRMSDREWDEVVEVSEKALKTIHTNQQ